MCDCDLFDYCSIHIIRADRQLRKELEAITDPKLRAECLRAFDGR